MARNRATVGSVLIVVGLLLPPAVWFGGDAIISALSSADPRPDQNAILLAFLGFWGSVAAGVVLGIAGIILLLRRSPTRRD